MSQSHPEVPAPQPDDPDEVKHWYDLSITQALCLAIFIAIFIAGVGVSLYLHSNNHKYDINRPGSKYNAPQLTITDDTAIDTNSPIDTKVISGESKMIQTQLDQLPPYGNYKDQGLSDGALGITQPNTTTKQ